MKLVNGMVCLSRPAMYRGEIPVQEHGWKCLLCRQEWWPAWVGCNDHVGPPVSHDYRHVREDKCPLVEAEKERDMMSRYAARISDADLDF